MAQKQISYSASSRLACSSCLPADIILCVPAEFVAAHLCSDASPQTYEYRHIEAQVTAVTKSVDCAFNTYYTYTFEFDDTQLITDSGFLSSDITGVFCKGCLTNWVEDLVGNEVAVTVDGSDVTITSQHGCETTFSAGGGAGWELTGNAGTIIGTNFLGTTDNVDLEFRINNQEVFRFKKPFDYTVGAPNIIANPAFNIIDSATFASQEGNSILGGGDPAGGFNSIVLGALGESYWNTICGGAYNIIQDGVYNTIVGGILNKIEGDPSASGGCVICGGQGNQIGIDHGSVLYRGAGDSFIGSGVNNEILAAYQCAVVSGNGNKIKSSTSLVIEAATICGGYANSILRTSGVTDGDYSAILGGKSNIIIGNYSSSLGGAGLTLGSQSVGYNSFAGGTTDLSNFSTIAYFGGVDLWIGNTTGTSQKLKFFADNSSSTYAGAKYSSLEAQAQAANIEYKLPTTAGIAGQSLKIQSVAGTVVTLEWA